MSGGQVPALALDAVDLDPHERSALAVLQEAAAGPLGDGRARLEVQLWPGGEREAPPRVLALVPAAPGACLLRCSAHLHGADLWLGPDGTLVEVWVPDPEERRAELRRHVRAVLAGRYRERRYVARPPGVFRRRAVPCVEGELELDGETVRFRHWEVPGEARAERRFTAY